MVNNSLSFSCQREVAEGRGVANQVHRVPVDIDAFQKEVEVSLGDFALVGEEGLCEVGLYPGQVLVLHQVGG